MAWGFLVLNATVQIGMMKKILDAIRRFLQRYRTHFTVAGFVAVLLLAFLWPRMMITVGSGELGVLYSRFFGGTVLDRVYKEGLHVISPWNTLFVYDTRIQEETQAIDVLTLDGLTVTVQVSLRYQVVRDSLPILHQQIGPDYRRKIILPILTSAVRQTIGSFRPDALYSTARGELQDKMLVDATEEMGRIPILIHGFVVREIVLPEVLRTSIVEKLVAEQKYLRYHFLLLEAKEEAKRKAIEGEAVRYYQSLVNENMTENFLRYEGIQATAKLAASENAKVVVVGSGKDGLPLILNTQDTSRPSAGHNAGVVAPKADVEDSGTRSGAGDSNSSADAGGPGPESGWRMRSSGFVEFLERLDKVLLNPAKNNPQAMPPAATK